MDNRASAQPVFVGQAGTSTEAAMDYKYSMPLPSHLQTSQFDFAIKPRVSLDAAIADKGCQAARDDWGAMGGNPIANGCMGEEVFSNLVALIAPEAIPERLWNASYASEVGFIYDDVIEEEYLEDHGAAVTGQTDLPTVVLSAKLRVKQMMAKCVVLMAQHDHSLAVEYLRTSEEWESGCRALELKGIHQFSSLDDLITNKFVTNGTKWTDPLIAYLCDIHLTKEEAASIQHLRDMLYVLAMIVGDINSFDKEYDAFIATNRPGPLDSVLFYLLVSQGTTVGQAKDQLRKKFKETQLEYFRMKHEYMLQNRLAKKIGTWLHHLELCVAGACVWAARGYRYNAELKHPEYRPRDTDTLTELLGKERSISSQFWGRCCQQDGDANTRESSEIFGGLTELESVKADQEKYLTVSNGTLQSSSSQTIREAARTSQHSKLLDESVSGLFNLGSRKTANNRIPNQVILEPYDYIDSLPSKRIRDLAIDALDLWYKVPEDAVATIKAVINLLHNSSLMLDDIEDESPLRRGYPATHLVFGSSQTINCANFLFVKCLGLLSKLSLPAYNIFADLSGEIEELQSLHVGQGYDLHWTYHGKAPSTEEYLQMVDGKTGGLFRMASRLMRCEATANKDLVVESLLTALGRYYQIRDDYQNLNSPEYFQTKGEASDLDERKYSFPLILALAHSNTRHLSSLLQARVYQGSLRPEQKELMMKYIHQTNALERTCHVMDELMVDIKRRVAELEAQAGGVPNWMLQAIILRLENIK
ncbi:hypothetical protein N7523_006420 [Penicillium sp. IBT 18751x]|nr:hypothetical protein N7523_006420 [Penicillium sp. IBT 18751x]